MDDLVRKIADQLNVPPDVINYPGVKRHMYLFLASEGKDSSTKLSSTTGTLVGKGPFNAVDDIKIIGSTLSYEEMSYYYLRTRYVGTGIKNTMKKYRTFRTHGMAIAEI
jgi:hypothetical protein